MAMKAKNAVRVVLLTVIPTLAGFGVLILTIAFLAGAFTTKIEPGQRDRAVRKWTGEPIEVVHEVTKDYTEESVGALKAANRTAISSKVMATIREINAKAGDQVQEGDVLVRLDSAELEARLRQTEQSLAAAVAARKQAEQDFDRAKSLFDRGAVPQAELDKATARLNVAIAEESRAQQGVDESQAQLSYATIVAPKSGRVVDRLAERGDTARPGEPLLVLYDASSLRLEAPVPENLALQLKVGQAVRVYIDALEREMEAKIDERVPQADALSRSFLVKAKLPPSPDLYEGLFGRLIIPAGQRRHLCLATDAIRRLGQLEFVNVVLPDETIEQRFIKTGRLGMPGRIEVLSGLKAGEKVIVPQDSDEQLLSDER
jgi:RND family efflux transporter MFP subunit